MPQTEANSTDELAIAVERDSYFPGDTITGTISRVDALVHSEVTIDVVLHGRTKSKFIHRKDNRNHYYRGRYDLLNLEQRVFQGSINIPGNAEPQQWNFDIQIPINVDAGSYPGKHKDYDSFIPIDNESVSKMDLPGSVLQGHSSGYYRREGFVEYYLEAVFNYQRCGHSSTKKETAVVPIELIALNPSPPVTDFALLSSEKIDSVTSQRLLPGMENAELSTMDSLKKLFHTSSVPDFAFNCEVSAPSLFQISQPAVPFLIRIIPIWPDTSKTIQGKPQRATLISFRAVLQSTCQILCASGAMGFNRHQNWWDDFYELEGDGFDNRPLAIEIPCGDDVAPADIGTAMHLRLPSEVFQTFTTFNISLSWQLDWWAECEIAGETFTAHGNQEVEVVPASTSGLPPSFDEVNSEDKHAVVGAEKKDLE